jgi:undecaprenyl-diphosphatase
MIEKFMSFISIKQNFIIPGAIAVILLLWVYRLRGLACLLAGGIMVGLNDFISHNFIKELVARPRPCHTLPDLQHITNCSNSFSFPSNHASNMFTVATVLSLCFKNLAFLAYTFAILVCYSRVYLGVHYPFDVLGGALLGIGMGVLGYKLYKKFRKFLKA